MSKVLPIKPKDVQRLKKSQTEIPNDIIQCFNEMIVAKWDGHKSHIKQNDMIEYILDHTTNYTRRGLFDNHYLDVEEFFSDNGWDVVYDKPGFNELYDAFWVFKEKE